MPGFAEKLNIQNCENSSGYCVHYICTKCLDFQEINIQSCGNSAENCEHYVPNFWITKKIESSERGKSNEKLRMLYIYGMFGLAKKLSVQN